MRKLRLGATLMGGLMMVTASALFAQDRQVPQSQAAISLSFSPVVKTAAPSVVSIYTSQVVERRVNPFAGDPMFERLFRDFGATRPQVRNSLGSGVVVSADGLVVSNYHVVEGADQINVVLHDRRQMTAKVVLADRDNDLAVLKLEGAANLPAIALRDSDEVEVGDLVLAIGNPFGLDQTVSFGIVSALSRPAGSVGDGRGYFLQTDAAINPGNSGGALVDATGQLVGINTAILTQSGGSNGVGFAIPSNLVRTLVAQAAAGNERFVRPWAGLTGQAVDGTLSESLGLDHPEGLLISDLHPDSPFARAGLRSGDLVLRFDGHAVNAPQELLYRMSAKGPGTDAVVDYRRGTKDFTARVAMIAPPDSPARETRVLGREAGPLQGLELMRVNPAVQEEFRLSTVPQGALLISNVSGAALRSSLRSGDLLLAVNGQPAETPARVPDLLRQGAPGLSLDLLRDGRALRLRLRG